jgi:prophage DNA circulation protein
MADLIDYLAATSYEGERFPVVECMTRWGHDSAAHTRLGGQGADMQPTGEKPVTVQLRMAFVDGLVDNGIWPRDLWPAGFERTIELLRTRPQGTLSHPSRGPMTVQVGDVEEPIDAKVRNGVYLTVNFTQHLEDTGLNLQRPSAPAAAPTEATTQAAAADAIRPAGVPEISTTVTTELAAIEAAAAAFGAVTGAIDRIVSAAQSRLVYPLVMASAGYEYRAAIGALIVAAWKLKEFYGTTLQPWKFTVPENMSLSRIAALPHVYGDPSKASVIRSANRISNPVVVPAGTVLLIPLAA